MIRQFPLGTMVLLTGTIGVAAVLSACVPPAVETTGVSVTAQPRLATYRCDGETEMTVEALQDKVHVVSPRGVDVELPASPPAQRNRYGTAPYALVMEGNEALWMVSGKEPINCSR